MKKAFVLLFVLLPLFVRGQIITTFAGNGSLGGTGDGGPATIAPIGEPNCCTFDKNDNFYFTTVSNDKVRMVTPSGIISTIAGTGTSGYNGDEIAATNAEINTPVGIAIDISNNIYIADSHNNRIRRINAITGIISTIAGNGTGSFGGDGDPATTALLNTPGDICFDRFGNLYIVDVGNFKIRKINTSGIINTVAGNGAPGYSGDGGMATSANIENVVGLRTDVTGNFYFTQLGDARVRKVTIATGIITTIAGNGLAGTAGDGGPATSAQLNPMYLAFDRIGNLYISGYIDNDVRMIDNSGLIHTVAGTGAAGFMGDNGPAIDAELASPNGIALDTCDNLYIADKVNIRIRKVAFNPYCWALGVNNISAGTALKIYPNPAMDELNIDNAKPQTSYALLNIIGQTAQQGTLKAGSNSISVQSLSPGIYMLEIQDEEGRRMVRKIVKE